MVSKANVYKVFLTGISWIEREPRVVTPSLYPWWLVPGHYPWLLPPSRYPLVVIHGGYSWSLSLVVSPWLLPPSRYPWWLLLVIIHGGYSWSLSPDTTIPSDYHTGYPRPYSYRLSYSPPLDTTLHPNSHATLPYITIIWMRNE
jgi:hypothetical protein